MNDPASHEWHERAADLHTRSIVVDGLDVSLHDADHWEVMKRGGVTAANATVTVER